MPEQSVKNDFLVMLDAEPLGMATNPKTSNDAVSWNDNTTLRDDQWERIKDLP